VRRLESVSTEQAELWVKDDGVLHPLYGGNKIRKLEYLLGDALRLKSKRVVAVGSASSHHVLATALFAQEVGLKSASVLCPHPLSDHARQVLEAIAATGTDVVTARSMAHVPLALARLVRRGDYVLWPGGSSVTGALGYVDAAAELAQQIREGVLPEPDVVVVPLGSGGTAAGLAAGALRFGLSATVLGVSVVGSRRSAEWLSRSLVWAIMRAEGVRAAPHALDSTLRVTELYRGRGYGWPTDAGQKATDRAARAGLRLDPTYTAKAFAAALDCVSGRASQCWPAERTSCHPVFLQRHCPGPLHVLYWHTLSSATPSRSVISNLAAGRHARRAASQTPAEWDRLLIRV
jgi:D-cysteine desulfhydrase